MKTTATPGTERAGDLAHHLIAARLRLHLSVEEVAARADMHPNYLRYLEASTGLPSSTCLRALAGALHITEETLLGGTDQGA